MSQTLEREPQENKIVQFVLTEAEQDELMRFLWPQWISPNDFPALHGLMHRLQRAKDTRA